MSAVDPRVLQGAVEHLRKHVGYTAYRARGLWRVTAPFHPVPQSIDDAELLGRAKAWGYSPVAEEGAGS